MHLQKYLQKQDIDAVVEEIMTIFHDYEEGDSKKELEDSYRAVIYEMSMDIRPHKNNDFVLFFYPIFEEDDLKTLSMTYRSAAIDPDEFKSPMPIPLFGECHRSIYHYNLALTDWKEALGYQVYDLAQTHANQIALAYLIYEMTWYGSDYLTCKQEQLNFFSRLEEQLISQVGQIAFEQVFDEIGVRPHQPFMDEVDNLRSYENHLSELAYVRAFNRKVTSENY